LIPAGKAEWRRHLPALISASTSLHFDGVDMIRRLKRGFFHLIHLII
jgi:hypothetical protein